MTKVTSAGARICELAHEHGLSQRSLAKVGDTNPTHINRIYSGEDKPRTEVVLRLAEKFQVNPWWLLGYDAPKRALCITDLANVKTGRRQYTLTVSVLVDLELGCEIESANIDIPVDGSIRGLRTLEEEDGYPG